MRLPPRRIILRRFLKERNWWEWLFFAVCVASVGDVFIGELRTAPVRFFIKILVAMILAALALAIYESVGDYDEHYVYAIAL